MAHEIAVFLNDEGKTCRLTELGYVMIYTRKMGEWKEAGKKDFTLTGVRSMTELREKMEELTDFLADCKIFVVAKVSGIALNILEQAQFRIWEWKGRPLDFLDTIRLQGESDLLANNENSIGDIRDTVSEAKFTETSPGSYAVSLKEIQENNSSITSKQALLPFLKKGKFDTLEIICNHVPQWLESELMALNQTMQVERKAEGLVKVSLKKAVVS